MDKNTLFRYNGYLKTPFLFKNNRFEAFEQLQLDSISSDLDDNNLFKNQRLGKLVEEFLFFQLKQQNAINWVKENIQIQNNRKTIGELDAIYSTNDELVHLEIVYKFYLYDTLKIYKDPLSYWIGPNRKDSLDFKLNKLKSKQFPLLYNEVTKKQLSEQNINAKDIKQELFFKAQLFIPYQNPKINIEPLNDQCISGFYISFNNTSIFSDLEFYIPNKLDWLIIPHNNVKWSDYTSILSIIEEHIKAHRSPLVWLKYNDAEFKKCFITWW